MLSLFWLGVTQHASPYVQSGGGNNTLLIISILVAAIFGTGGVFAFLTARAQSKKLRAEASKLEFDRGDGAVRQQIMLAQGAVVVQSGVIKDLQDQVKSQHDMIEVQSAAINDERRKLNEYREHAEAEHKRLETLVVSLETRYTQLLVHVEKITLERDRYQRQVANYKAE